MGSPGVKDGQESLARKYFVVTAVVLAYWLVQQFENDFPIEHKLLF